MHQITLKFSVKYDTVWGESLVLSGGRGLLGEWDVHRGVPLTCHPGPDGCVWEGSIDVPVDYVFMYTYVVINEAKTVVHKEMYPHSLSLPRTTRPGDIIQIVDTFQAAADPENVFKSRAFRDVVFGGRAQRSEPEPDLVAEPLAGLVTVRFSVSDCVIPDGEALFVYGNIAELGSWQESKALEMTEVSTPLWACTVVVPATSFPFHYRYFVAGTAKGNSPPNVIIADEAGEPRVATLAPPGERAHPGVVLLNDGHFRHKTLWRGSGLAVPIFSLRTRASVGCGEFMDCKLMVDLLDACGIRVFQVLPINDTSVHKMWYDSYPYSSLSVFALHPLYLCLSKLLEGSAPSTTVSSLSARIDAARTALAGEPCDGEFFDVDYEATMEAKLTISRLIFDKLGAARDLKAPEFQEWLARNEAWVKPYAAFCFLRDLFGTSDHSDWGCMGENAPAHVERITAPSQEYHASIQYIYWLQWHLHKQLLEVASYAVKRRVVLKGDLPIGVDKRSVDTWLQPALFQMDVGVGSPPDAFDPNGQNWGFPSYNWEAMEEDGYAWWQARLRHMAQYFSAFRVDHILGFFRIYEVPSIHVTGALGKFRPSRALTKHQLEGLGLWDLDRLCEPYITPEIVQDVMGELAASASAMYMTESEPGRFKLKPPYINEAAIMTIQPRRDSPQWLIDEVNATRRGLLKLRQNVILLRDEHDPGRFYPRFHLAKTSSFAAFDPSKHALLQELHDGYFYHNHDELWRANALKTIPVLMQATDMLMCGEDLGFVPGCVPPVMHELGVIALRIQRMPSSETPAGAEFGRPANYKYLTVASPACHDTSTTRAWYEENPGRRERFFYRCLEGSGEVPEACTPEIMHTVAMQHMNSPAILCIMPVQDWLALSAKYLDRPAGEETINDPTNPQHYWRYRMHHSLEDVLADTDFISAVQCMHLQSGRAAPSDFRGTKHGLLCVQGDSRHGYQM